jgi:hypothetical protein
MARHRPRRSQRVCVPHAHAARTARVTHSARHPAQRMPCRVPAAHGFQQHLVAVGVP